MNETPQAIRSYLSRRYTNVRAAQARIEQVFYPERGWITLQVPSSDVTTYVVRRLAQRGATVVAIGYNRPLPAGGGRQRADFTVRELVAA